MKKITDYVREVAYRLVNIAYLEIEIWHLDFKMSYQNIDFSIFNIKMKQLCSEVWPSDQLILYIEIKMSNLEHTFSNSYTKDLQILHFNMRLFF